MMRLSSSIDEIKDHYAVVVIGSGYGGAIAASRLARAGQRVCVLERGKELQPGEYPDTEPEFLRELQVDLPEGHGGSRTGLYDLRVNEEINAFVGCGLGGTSLVNANVSLRVEPRVFEDPRWPQALRNDVTSLLEDGYRRAEEMLKPTPYPNHLPPLAKSRALKESATALNETFYHPPINVSFQDGLNHVGVYQQACRLCGDCISGCNHAAKNTVLMNYLPDAANHGAEIFTQVSVRLLEPKGGSWRVHYQLLDSGRERFGAPTMFVSAEVVILAAGTLGSTEILLRSKSAGVPLSDRVGCGFSGNGDVLGFGYNNREPIEGIGFGHRPPSELLPVGPCITGIIDARQKPQLNDGLVIEEGAVPGAFSAFLLGALAAASKIVGSETISAGAVLVEQEERELDSLLRGPYHGAVRNTQTYLVMTHDDGVGRMVLRDDRLRIEWPGMGGEPIFQQVHERLLNATRALEGNYIKNPIWSKALRHGLVTVHPLGGCVLAEDAERGVVNHKGQVFSANSGDNVYDNLYVSDGSVIPRSLGVNPLLTISALAERCCALLAKDRGWQIDYRLPSARVGAPASDLAEAGSREFSSDSAVLSLSADQKVAGLPTNSVLPQPARLGIQFTETMRGYFSVRAEASSNPADSLPQTNPASGGPPFTGTPANSSGSPSTEIQTTPASQRNSARPAALGADDNLDDYRQAAQRGIEANSTFEFTLTITSADLDRMLTDSVHSARMIGTVTAPALSPQPLMVTEGEFSLFVVDPDQVQTRRMRYRMKLTSEEGRGYYFEGFKLIHDRHGFGPAVWPDTTTLYITVYCGNSPVAAVLGKGILRIRPEDFARQLTTMQVTHASNLPQRLQALSRFGHFFAGVLFDTYGGIFATQTLLNPDARPRKKRPLRAPTPEVHFFPALDSTQLRLIRYNGGKKGPVILSPGLGVSGLIFCIDTIETNLVEYLCVHGFDVWLLDYRTSIDLPASATQSTADEIAAHDYPAAVAKVRELTDAESTQMVAHCFGSTTFVMAMLGGLQGVRSAVCSQVATHLVTPLLTRIKCGLHFSELLQRLGVRSLTAYADTHENWERQLFNKALKFYPVAPEERCQSPACHRITFMYSLLYEHDQLNAATHDALHEMFGVANVRCFEHLGRMVREGHVVSARGADDYLPHLERLAIPITFIHGAENECFLPQSTEIAYNLLREKNGKNLYSRHVIAGYGHIDCIFGKNAVEDVYPFIVNHLQATN